MGIVDFIIVLILPHLPPCFQDRDPTESHVLYNSSSSSVHTAVSARVKAGGLKGLSRLCHITCFFTSTILWQDDAELCFCLCF